MPTRRAICLPARPCVRKPRIWDSRAVSRWQVATVLSNWSTVAGCKMTATSAAPTDTAVPSARSQVAADRPNASRGPGCVAVAYGMGRVEHHPGHVAGMGLVVATGHEVVKPCLSLSRHGDYPVVGGEGDHARARCRSASGSDRAGQARTTLVSGLANAHCRSVV